MKIGCFIEFFPAVFLFELHEVAQLAQEPAVDLRHVENFVDRDPRMQSGVYREQALVGHLADFDIELLFAHRRKFGMIERRERNFRAAHCFHDRLLERSADRHDFARRLHARTERSARVKEFIEGPFGKLDYNVVDGRLETGVRFARDVVLDFIERVTECDLGRNLGNGITRCLTCKRRRARNAGVDFDDRIFETVGMQRELAVTAALDAEFGDDIERSRAQHLIFFIRKRDGGRDDDGIARVDPDGVEVFHRADGEHVACAVAQYFEFDFLPSADILFDKHLRDGREHQAVVGNKAQFLFVMRHAAARAAQRVGRAHDDGISELFRNLDALFHRVGDIGRHDGLMDLFHRFFEEFAVFRAVDRAQRSADKPHAPLFQKSRFGKFIAHGQPRLSA